MYVGFSMAIFLPFPRIWDRSISRYSLPAPMSICVIKDTYGKFGFTSIETPCVENIANLSSKQGGDNEKLIFKILKRGEKLNVAAATTEEEVDVYKRQGFHWWGHWGICCCLIMYMW